MTRRIFVTITEKTKRSAVQVFTHLDIGKQSKVTREIRVTSRLKNARNLRAIANKTTLDRHEQHARDNAVTLEITDYIVFAVNIDIYSHTNLSFTEENTKVTMTRNNHVRVAYNRKIIECQNSNIRERDFRISHAKARSRD